MKLRFYSLLLAAVLAVPAMTGCQTATNAASNGNALQQMADTTALSDKRIKPALTQEKAQSIALAHAGFTVDQVTALHTEYEIEYGIPQYDVEFRQGAWEYDYEIHADTGEVLSFSKDD